MLKKSITYVDFNDQEVTETFYFNLSKAELLEMEMGTSGGFGEMLKRIVDSKDTSSLILEFKKIILSAYGKRSDDGKRFIKNDQLREEFTQTAAYSVLFMELATSDNAAVDFIKGVLPPDMGPAIEKELKEFAKAPLLPPPPTQEI